MGRNLLLALGLALIYVLLGGAWIRWSDAWLATLIDDARQLTKAQTVKGWLYVGISGILVYLLIITGLRRVERRERDFRVMFALGATAHAVLDADRKFRWVNPALAGVAGRPIDDMLRCRVAPEEIWPDVSPLLADCPAEPVDAVLRTAAGEMREGVLTVARLPGDRLALAWTDLTVQLGMERRLSAAARLDSLGAIAAGVAHDFNGILAVIRGFAEEVRSAPSVDADVRSLSDEILRAADRGGRLTAQILDAARGAERVVNVVDAGPVIADLREGLRRVLGPAVSLSIYVPTERLPVRIDTAQLEQIVINLVRNAGAAMDASGRLEVRVDRTGCEGLGPRLRISVQDSGRGMTSEEAEAAMEPFYTKGTKGGTGLGLPIVRAICDRVGGDVMVDSVPDRGTTVTVQLPLADDAAAPMPRLRPRGGSVLLVDDDPGLQRLIARMVGRIGFTTMTADSISTAEAIMRASRTSLDFVITDIQLPDGNGLEFAARVRQNGEGAPPVLVVSGYMDGPTRDAIGKLSGAAGLQKPFRADELEAALAALGKDTA